MGSEIRADSIIESVVVSMLTTSHSNLSDILWSKMLAEFPVVTAHSRGIDCHTMCTDGLFVYYDPEFIKIVCENTMEEVEEKRKKTEMSTLKSDVTNAIVNKIKFLLAHELAHIVYHHVGEDPNLIIDRIPPPVDKAYKILSHTANVAQDSIINAKLAKEYPDGVFYGIWERDEKGNKKNEKRFAFYNGDVEISTTQAFVEACNEMSKIMAMQLGRNVEKYPTGFYESVELFRELFNSMPKQWQDQQVRSLTGGEEDQDQKQDNKGSQNQSQGDKESQNQKQGDKESGGKKTKKGNKSDKKGPEGEIDGIGIKGAMERILGGSCTTDNHKKSEEITREREKSSSEKSVKGKIDDPIVRTKINSVMSEIAKAVEAREKVTIGEKSFKDFILVSLCKRYFKPKVEPWYVGLYTLFKNKVAEGRQVRERVPAIEMLSQVMGSSSVVTFERQCKKMNIAFAVDVSGSMCNEEVLEGVLRIINYAERELPKGSVGHRLIFAQIDADVVDWKDMKVPSHEFNQWKREIKETGFVRAGCGGTVFAPFFEKLNTETQKPDAVVVFSDMCIFDLDKIEELVKNYYNNIIWLSSKREVPDEFYRHKLGKVYEVESLFEEILEQQSMNR